MIASIDLFEILKARLGDAEAKMLVKEIEKVDSGIDAKIEKSFDTKKDLLASKNDISVIKEDLAKLEGRLETKIADSKADIIKWMVALILGLFIALIGSMAALIKLLH